MTNDDPILEGLIQSLAMPGRCETIPYLAPLPSRFGRYEVLALVGQGTAGCVYRALDLNGYARIDLRMDEEERVYVLEANPNPNLAYGEDFAESGEVAGISYERLLERIVTLGLHWEPERTG